MNRGLKGDDQINCLDSHRISLKSAFQIFFKNEKQNNFLGCLQSATIAWSFQAEKTKEFSRRKTWNFKLKLFFSCLNTQNSESGTVEPVRGKGIQCIHCIQWILCSVLVVQYCRYQSGDDYKGEIEENLLNICRLWSAILIDGWAIAGHNLANWIHWIHQR